MAVINSRNVILSHGINLSPEAVRNVTPCLLKRKVKKETQVQCSNCEYKEVAQK